jgi:hypothetical protein
MEASNKPPSDTLVFSASNMNRDISLDYAAIIVDGRRESASLIMISNRGMKVPIYEHMIIPRHG